MKEFKPNKTRIKEVKVIYNNGKIIYTYEAQYRSNYMNVFLLLLLIFIEPRLMNNTSWKTIGYFCNLQDAKVAVMEHIEKERQEWLKEKSETKKQYIKFP